MSVGNIDFIKKNDCWHMKEEKSKIYAIGAEKEKKKCMFSEREIRM